MNDSTQQAMESLAGFTTINLEQVLETKHRIFETAHVIKESNDQLYEGVSYATGMGQRHANNVTEIVMSMQFQDITKQRLDKTLGMLQQLQEEFEQQVAASQGVMSDQEPNAGEQEKECEQPEGVAV